jgi:hypothetical protein
MNVTVQWQFRHDWQPSLTLWIDRLSDSSVPAVIAYRYPFMLYGGFRRFLNNWKPHYRFKWSLFHITFLFLRINKDLDNEKFDFWIQLDCFFLLWLLGIVVAGKNEFVHLTLHACDHMSAYSRTRCWITHDYILIHWMENDSQTINWVIHYACATSGG